MPISIFPLFLLMGVASTFPWDSPWRLHDDDTVFRPIIGRSNERRICVELCSSGLGGDPCGEDCKDLSPFGVQIQSTSSAQSAQKKALTGSPRNDSCPLLCENNLGNPLCDCRNIEVKTIRVNFVKICANFCIKYDYQIYGCQSCKIYKDVFQNDVKSVTKGEKNKIKNGLILSSVQLAPHWVEWCVNKCSQGEGGSACNCDKPVMAI
ncbi:hypothetical protein WA026_017973 [Henosepilachna vigintioctopunctata]|uniref:Uncharacterized protein n=1 Tax=Henosepilachna vigintioctopunctata TaxID=420089 RepID=A0AAW1TVQ9_9CUCU